MPRKPKPTRAAAKERLAQAEAAVAAAQYLLDGIVWRQMVAAGESVVFTEKGLSMTGKVGTFRDWNTDECTYYVYVDNLDGFGCAGHTVHWSQLEDMSDHEEVAVTSTPAKPANAAAPVPVDPVLAALLERDT